jgi:hypothetical protein
VEFQTFYKNGDVDMELLGLCEARFHIVNIGVGVICESENKVKWWYILLMKYEQCKLLKETGNHGEQVKTERKRKDKRTY